MKKLNQINVSMAISNFIKPRLQAFRPEIYDYTESELIDCGSWKFVVLNFELEKERGFFSLLIDIKSFDEEYVVRPKHGLSRRTPRKWTEIPAEESELRLLMQELCKNEVILDQLKAYTNYYKLDYEMLMAAVNAAEPNIALDEYYQALAKERAKYVKVSEI